MFKASKSEFCVMVAIMVTKTHTKTKKQDGSLGAFLTNSSKCSPDPEKPEFGTEGQRIRIKLLLNLKCMHTHTHAHTRTHTNTHINTHTHCILQD